MLRGAAALFGQRIGRAALRGRRRGLTLRESAPKRKGKNMLFAFVIVLFAGLAFMFLCLLRGQEKVVKTVREELVATRARLEALERRLGPSASPDSSDLPASAGFAGPAGSFAPLDPLDSPRPVASPFSLADARPDRPDGPLVLLTAGMTRAAQSARSARSDGAAASGGANEPDGWGTALSCMGGSALPVPETPSCPKQREESPLADAQNRADDAESPRPDRLDMDRGGPDRPEPGRIERGRLEMDRLAMEPPSAPYAQGEARRARDAGMPDLKL